MTGLKVARVHEPSGSQLRTFSGFRSEFRINRPNPDLRSENEQTGNRLRSGRRISWALFQAKVGRSVLRSIHI